MIIVGWMNFFCEEWILFVSDLGEELQVMGMLVEVVCVVLEYIYDVDFGVRLLLEVREWMEVVRVFLLYVCEDFLFLFIELVVLECVSVLIEEFIEGFDKVRKYFLCYQIVRQWWLVLVVKLKVEEDGEWVDDDIILEVSSYFSSMSVYFYGYKLIFFFCF